jgi:long-chain fatty acid transport protein
VNVTQSLGSSSNSGATPLEVNTVTANYKGSADIVGLAARYSF